MKNSEGRVWVIVVPISEPTPLARETPPPDEILRLAAQVYESLSPDDMDKIERLAFDRSHFFVS